MAHLGHVPVGCPRSALQPDLPSAPRPNPVPTDVSPLVETLIRLVADEPRLSPAFKDLWRRYVGA